MGLIKHFNKCESDLTGCEFLWPQLPLQPAHIHLSVTSFLKSDSPRLFCTTVPGSVVCCAHFCALAVRISCTCPTPPPPPLLLSVITTTPLAAFQCCHQSQGFRQITSESGPLQSIMALRRVLREREVCYGCRLFQALIDPNLCSSKQHPAHLWDWPKYW